MIPEMIRKALIEIGNLEERILDVERNGSDNGFIITYDKREFYFNSNLGYAALKMPNEDYRLVTALERLLGGRHYRRTSTKKEIIYEWNPKSYGDMYSAVE